MVRAVSLGVRRSWGFWLLVAVALAVGAPTAATAQGRYGGASHKLELIRKQMEKGQDLYLAGKYAAAAAVFEAGYKNYPYSAFLFNAGVCYQKMKDLDHALEKFREYVRVDPNAPDADKVKARIAKLSEAQKPAPPPPEAGPPPTSDAGPEDGSAGDAGAAVAGDAGAPPAEAGAAPVEAGAPPAPPVDISDDQNAMKSLVVVETEPPGAPLALYRRTSTSVGPFHSGGANPGWKEVEETTSPANFTLDIGRYHVVVKKFRDFNASETDIDVSPGHVYQFKANLSQGAFMSFLRVSANVRGAHIYLDDKLKKHPEWGVTPYGELVTPGKHTVLVEAPGFQPALTPIEVKHGQQKQVEVKLVRVKYGYIRLHTNAAEAKVSIDKQPVGYWRSGEPPLMVKADAGDHKLTIRASGRKTYEGVIKVPRGQVLPVRARMIPKFPRGTAWTQAAIGAAFVGASVYFGVESNRLYDQVNADRKAGVLEQGDNRITQGRWYSIGADAGFVVGGVLGVLATYNFIRDPLPPSSIKTGKPVDFPDPSKAKRTALVPRRVPSRLAGDRPLPRRTAPSFTVGPLFGSRGVGFGLGGRF